MVIKAPFSGEWRPLVVDFSYKVHFEELPHYNYNTFAPFETKLTINGGSPININGFLQNEEYIFKGQDVVGYMKYHSGDYCFYGLFGTEDAVGKLKIVCDVSCQGCLEEQPNQLAHMYMGGCLE